MRQCPRFQRCSVPICPLDLLQDERDYLPGEPKCTMAKSIRYRIGQDNDLPRKGLTKMEWAARQRYLNRSPEEKEQFKNQGKGRLRSYRNSRKDKAK